MGMGMDHHDLLCCSGDGSSWQGYRTFVTWGKSFSF